MRGETVRGNYFGFKTAEQINMTSMIKYDQYVTFPLHSVLRFLKITKNRV